MPRKSKSNGAAKEMTDVAAGTAVGESNRADRKKQSDIFYAVVSDDGQGGALKIVQKHANIWKARKAIPHLQSALLAIGQRVDLFVWKCRPVSEDVLHRRRAPRQ